MFIPALATAKGGDIIRGKWMLDGTSTLAEVADRLREAALAAQALHDAGWTLDGPVDGDFGHLIDPTGNAGPNGDETDEPDEPNELGRPGDHISEDILGSRP